MIPVQPYLYRLRYSGSLQPTLDTLNALYRAHLVHIPFENLDTFLNQTIQLEPEALYLKLVLDRRGGLCYELNGLFGCLLTQLGFRVELLSAQVVRQDGSYGPEFDHLCLKVELDGNGWIADVGFGDHFVSPLKLKVTDPTPSAEYRWERDPSNWTLLRCQGGEWDPVYRLQLQPRQLSEFAPMSRFHQTSEDSLFTHSPLCTIAISSGRITLSKANLSIREGSHQSHDTLPTQTDYLSALSQYFGITLADPDPLLKCLQLV